MTAAAPPRRHPLTPAPAARTTRASGDAPASGIDWRTAVARFDLAAERLAARYRSGRLDDAAHVLSAAADRAKLTAGISMARWATDRRNGRRIAVRTIAGVLVTTAIVDVAKQRVGRSRPANGVPLRYGVRPQTSASFPSGHAVSAAMVAVSVSERRPSWRVPLALFALAVGWSRIQVGLHHASDVAGGLVIGTVAGFVLRRVVSLPAAAEDQDLRH